MSIPPGTIAILNQGTLLLELVAWIELMRERYPGRLYTIKPRGNQIARQRNIALEGCRGEWVLFVDSDCVPPLDALERLLEHEVGLVGGVVLERYSPFWVAAVRSVEPPHKWALADLPKGGLLAVEAIGTSLMLLRHPIWTRLGEPWFRCGQIVPDLLMEDVEFCLRAKAAGIQPYLDCAVRAGHRVEAIVWPGRDGQKWFEWPGLLDSREPIQVSEGITV